MSIFFNAPYWGAGGPCEVNRNIVKCLKGRMRIKKIKNSYIGYVENFIKILFSKVVVFSGLMYKPYEVAFAKVLGKKIVYLMHGCIKIEHGYESKIENDIIKNADLILCVSFIFRDKMRELFPDSSEKFEVLMNGVDWQEMERVKLLLSKNYIRDENRVILFGGGRKIKMNFYICQAINEINIEDNTEYKVDVYGYFSEKDDSAKISAIPCVRFNHVIPHEQVNVELAKSRLFVQNSSFESFSLSLMDALMCGCDVLFSKNVGAQDFIDEKYDNDIIFSPTDIKELKKKIRYVLNNSNNERLLNSINRNLSSIETAADNLVKYCSRYE